MALSMDEQRILSEIEQHLAQAEPKLAARFAALGRTRAKSEAPRRIVAAFATALLVAAVSLVVYGLVSLRGGQPAGGNGPGAPAHTVASPRTVASQSASPGASAGSSR